MKKIRLKSLAYNSFKAQNQEIVFGDNTIISGKNGTGKTTVIKAWLWLLTGKTDPFHGANHEIFDNRFELDENSPVTRVKATIEINGSEYTLERTAKAKFVRKRGYATYEKASSDEYKYLVDEINCSQKEFDEWIDNNICDHEMLIYCASGDVFTTLAEEDRDKARKMLETLVGEPSKDDIKGDFSEIEEDLAKYGLEATKTRIKNMIKPLNEALSALPILIQEKTNRLSETSRTDKKSLADEIEKNKKRMSEIDKTLSGETVNPERAAALRKQAEANEKMLLEKEKYLRAENNRKQEILEKIDDIRRQLTGKDELSGEISAAERQIEALEKEKEELGARMEKARNVAFDDSEAVCPYCKQQLPYSIIEDRKREFLVNKKKEIDRINEEGKAIAERLETLKTGKEQKLKALSSTDYDSLASEKERLQEDLYKTIPFEQTERYKELEREIEDIHIPVDDKNMKDNLSKERNELEETVLSLQKDLAKAESDEEFRTTVEAEIQRLKAEQNEKRSEIASLEYKYQMAFKYESEKADALAEMVNRHLSGCKVQMWETQKNGERKESCTIRDTEGVKYSTLNNSARLLINIQMQKLFCELNGIEMPIMCDECSVYDKEHLPTGDGQYVYIYCSEDEKLKIIK